MRLYLSQLPQFAALVFVVKCHQNQPPIGNQHMPPEQHHQGHAQQQQQQQQGGHQAHQGGHGKFGAPEEVQDAEHIKSHLEGDINVEQQKLTDEQLQFHYFKMHDSNDDNRLDGVELVKAVTHFHDEAQEKDPKHAPPKMSEQEIEEMIDSILRDDDFNHDGYIDYSEFVRAQKERSSGQRTPPPQ